MTGPTDHRADAAVAYREETTAAVDLLRVEFPHLYDRCLQTAREYGRPVSLDPAVTLEPDEELEQLWLGIAARQVAAPRLLTNQVRCLSCDGLVTSTHRHHFVTCACGSTSVDGGLEYLRRCWDTSGPGYQELSVHETTDQVRIRLRTHPTNPVEPR